MVESAPEQEMDDMQEKYRQLADVRVKEARISERLAEIAPV